MYAKKVWKHNSALRSHLRDKILLGYNSWDVHTHEKALTDVWPASEIVYLTADSPHTIERLEAGKKYIIGGLLDHNQHSGASLALANQMGVAHAKLPIDDYVKLATRKVGRLKNGIDIENGLLQILTINQVFEILLRFYETQNWESAFLTVIPQRKGIEKQVRNKKATFRSQCAF